MGIAEIQAEMMRRRRELIDLQTRVGGVVTIELKSDNLTFFYNPNRKAHHSNPAGEHFYIQGTLCGCPVIMNESDVLLTKPENEDN